MKKALLILLGAATALTLKSQCEFIDISVSTSTETQIQLYTPSPFFVPNPGANEHFWDISDSNGNVIAQETTDSEGNLFLFEHTEALTDTITACLTISNELAGPGIDCSICVTLAWGGNITNWEIVSDQIGGVFEATQAPVPNYFLVGQSAPCPPRVINFQNFTWGSDAILWSFPGGDPASSTSNNQVVTYNSPGDYSFTIEVSNVAGSTSLTSTDEITVFPNPIADFTFSASDLTVFFESLSQGQLNPGQTIDYFWDFGDGNMSTEESPTYTYDVGGSYTVIHSITNQCGTSETISEIPVLVLGVENLDGLNSAEILPNPSNGDFEVWIENQKSQKLQFTLINTAGQVIVRQSMSISNGTNRINIVDQTLSPGIYFLEIASQEHTRSLRVLVN